jgi:hypothetical protein
MLLGRVPSIATERTGRREAGVTAHPYRPVLYPPVHTPDQRPHGTVEPGQIPPRPAPQPGYPVPPGPTSTPLPDTPPHHRIEPREDEKACTDCVHRILRGFHPTRRALAPQPGPFPGISQQEGDFVQQSYRRGRLNSKGTK